MRYVSLADLSKMIRSNINLIPHDIDLVVGVPRSGMLAATMIALYLNKSLTDLESFVYNRITGGGRELNILNQIQVKKY